MMIRKIKIYITLAAVAFSTASCLDKYPKDAILEENAIKSMEEVNQAVIGIYAAFKSSALYSGHLTLLPDIQADFVYAVEGYTNVHGDIWRWNILSNNTEVEAVYGALYRVIGQCNFLLEKIAPLEKTVNDTDYEKLQGFKGEAYFARALAYSELIKMYCKAYDKQTAENVPGVVLISSYFNPEPLKRSSLEASYQFVLADLEKASEYLAMTEDEETASPLANTIYFTKYAVESLYARVYLYMKEWQKAIDHSSEVIDSKKYSLSSVKGFGFSTTESDYSYMWTNDISRESIWKVGYTTTSYGAPLGQIFFNFDFSSYRPDYVPAAWVLRLYDANDLRYGCFFKVEPTGYAHQLRAPLLRKYYGTEAFIALNRYGFTMPKVFRLSEQYLIRAEAYSNLAQYSLATKDITTLRTARYSSYGSATVNATNWFEVISGERVKELYMEGFRLNDLKRWMAQKENGVKDKVKGFKREPQLSTVAPGNNLKISADNPSFVWPIPQHELDIPGADIEPNDSNK